MQNIQIIKTNGRLTKNIAFLNLSSLSEHFKANKPRYFTTKFINQTSKRKRAACILNLVCSYYCHKEAKTVLNVKRSESEERVDSGLDVRAASGEADESHINTQESSAIQQ